MGANDSAMRQVQAALADSSKLSHLAVPAQQAARQQLEGPHGLAQGTGAVSSGAPGLYVTASAASWQHPAGALAPPAGSQGGEGSMPAGDDYLFCLQLASSLIVILS